MPLVHELKFESLLSFTFYVVKDVHFFFLIAVVLSLAVYENHREALKKYHCLSLVTH